MKLIKNILRLFWRLWFYILIFVSVTALSPILLIVTSSVETYPIFFKIAQIWAKCIVFLMGFKVETIRKTALIPNHSYMFSGNHTSMIDPFVMIALIPHNPSVFVGKVELAKIPIFGFFYRRTCILVDRSNAESRKEVYIKAQQKLDRGLSACIFPEGLVPEEHVILSEFKNGAFSLAIEHKIPIVPISFLDCKKRFSYTFFSGGPGVLRVKFHDPIYTDNMTIEKDKDLLKQQVYDLIYKDLTDPNLN
jgi:1-acyl-sn-glycerol-3-phosphate acyltransferase